MIYVLDASGNAVRCMPERVYQGAAEGCKLYLAAPFAAAAEVGAVFALPDGTAAGPFRLEPAGAFAEDEGALRCWQRALPACVTARCGAVRVQFFYTDGAGQKTACEPLSFTVEAGVPVDMTQIPDEEVYDALTAALSGLSQRVGDGQYAARSLYAYESTRVYGINELVFVAEHGSMVRSLANENGMTPYVGDDVNAPYWEELLQFERVNAVLDIAHSAAQSAESAKSSAENFSMSAAASREEALQFRNEAQQSQSEAALAKDAAQQAQAACETYLANAAEEIIEAVADVYVSQEAFGAVLDGSTQVGKAQRAEQDEHGVPISLSGIMVGEVKLFAATVNPSETLGGTWEQLTADAYFKIVTTGAGATGGTSASHTIPLSSMPSHDHNFTELDNTGASGVNDGGRTIQRGYASTNALCSSLYQLDAQGGGQPYYPYYFGVYAWKRIA